MPDDIQATALSVFDMAYRVITIMTGLLVNYLANKDLQYGFLFAAAFSLFGYALFTFTKTKYY